MLLFLKDKVENKDYLVEIGHKINNEPDCDSIESEIKHYCDHRDDDPTFDFELMIKDVMSSFGLYYTILNHHMLEV